MRGQQTDTFETTNDDRTACQDSSNEPGPGTKLERRRRIEDLFEERRLREELGDLDLL